MNRITVRQGRDDWQVNVDGETVHRTPDRSEAKREARLRARDADSRPAVRIQTTPGVWMTVPPLL